MLCFLPQRERFLVSRITAAVKEDIEYEEKDNSIVFDPVLCWLAQVCRHRQEES